MRVITIQQPYASLIANGYKKYEFRNWKTNYRGALYIHAGLKVDQVALQTYQHLGLDFPTGVIVAKVNLVDCVLAEEVLSPAERSNNDYQYAFVLDVIEQINSTEKIRGKLGLWRLER